LIRHLILGADRQDTEAPTRRPAHAPPTSSPGGQETVTSELVDLRPDDTLAGTLARAVAQRAPTLQRPILQRQWVDGPDDVATWSEVTGGLRWRYDRTRQAMAFAIVDESKLDSEHLSAYRSLEHTWKSHQEWLRMGWGRIPLEKAVVKKSLEGDARLKAMVEAGTARAKNAVAFDMDERTLAARRDFFSGYYETKSDYRPRSDEERHDAHNILVKSTYRAAPLGSKERGQGTYNNTVRLVDGVFSADENYGLEGGELYYDPAGKPGVGWGKPSSYVRSLSNSDVVYQQWSQIAGAVKADYAEESPDFAPQLKQLVRNHVAGDGLEGLTFILGAPIEATGGKELKDGTRIFEPKDPGFYAMLSLPNCIAAVWLVHDHGKALKIRGIARITGSPQKTITIDFDVG
jgi:hypothetical protein